MSIFRTIALFVYLFGYMIVHYSVLCKAERALAAGDTETVRQLVKKHIPHWSKGILNVTGVRLSVEGLDNIPKDGPCVFVANHRSYYDIPLLLAGLDEPYGILAKEELGKIPLLNRWMKLLGCVFVQRDDVRASVRALNDATAIVESGRSFIIFLKAPATRAKGAPVSSRPVPSASESRPAHRWCGGHLGARGRPRFEAPATIYPPRRYSVRCCRPSDESRYGAGPSRKQLPDAVRQTILAGYNFLEDTASGKLPLRRDIDPKDIAPRKEETSTPARSAGPTGGTIT